MSRKLRWATLIPVILVLCLICFFSAEDAEESTETSGMVVDFVISIFMPDFSSYPPEEQLRLREVITHRVRKAAHFTEFALLGCALLIHVEAVRLDLPKRGGPYWPIPSAWAIGTFFAALDEGHQLFVSGRAGQWSDVAIDSAGVLTGTVVGLCMWYATSSWRRSHHIL